MNLVKAANIFAARERIERFIKQTSISSDNEADRLSSRRIYFKMEHLQCTGSFKARGALNAVLILKEKLGDKHAGVVTHSSGNHGQALAWAASAVGLPCTVVVPQTAPSCKIPAIEGYGAKVVKCAPNPVARVETMKKICEDTGQVYVSSCNDPDVIAGQGTIGLELLEQVPNLDAILLTVSGGGLAAGVAVAVKTVRPQCKVYLVTPQGKMMKECLQAGERLWPNPPQFLDTIADGIVLQQVEQNAFEILKELAEKEVFEMSDDEIIQGMKFSFHRMKVIEAAAGAAVAAIFTPQFRELDRSIQNVAVILCGGNVDIENLPWYPTYTKK